jgi:hypothetical protein
MKNSLFWNISLWSAEVKRRFGGTRSLPLQGRSKKAASSGYYSYTLQVKAKCYSETPLTSSGPRGVISQKILIFLQRFRRTQFTWAQSVQLADKPLFNSELKSTGPQCASTRTVPNVSTLSRFLRYLLKQITATGPTINPLNPVFIPADYILFIILSCIDVVHVVSSHQIFRPKLSILNPRFPDITI